MLYEVITAGEEFFQGSNPKGFDFGSVALGYTRKQGLLRQSYNFV